MALKLYNDLDETFLKGKNLDVHYDDHVAKDESDYKAHEHTSNKKFKPMSKQDYNDHGNELSQQPVYSSSLSDTHDVIGYYTINGRVVKYRKSTGELIAYKAIYDDQATISYYQTLGAEDNHASYSRKIRRDYLREILPEDDYYNR